MITLYRGHRYHSAPTSQHLKLVLTHTSQSYSALTSRPSLTHRHLTPVILFPRLINRYICISPQPCFMTVAPDPSTPGVTESKNIPFTLKWFTALTQQHLPRCDVLESSVVFPRRQGEFNKNALLVIVTLVT
ncbi:hypothetical protein O3P69_010580 [Scylla paramamosain]|uniref:Uncharacterized protein n=1 Tax=Scylla paramamosain TaxID=85552 RepID=A0AAW0TEB8_SCYPA